MKDGDLARKLELPFNNTNVNRLIRISFGPFNLKNLPSGELEQVKQRVLNDQLGITKSKKQNKIK